MRQLKLLSTLVLAMLYGSISYAQDFSNKGKDFYLCFPAHVPSSNNATLSIWITSDKPSSGTITMANGAFNGTFNIPAYGMAEIQVPWAAAHISNAESNLVIKKSIRVKTDPGKPPVVVYAQQWAGARSAATLVLPVKVLGKKYYSMNFVQNSNGKPQFDVIAVKDNTTVKITPRQNGAVGTPFNITLPAAGDIYQFQAAATADITGTLIESVASGNGGCVPIAVFTGTSNVAFGTQGCNNFGSSDPLFQQAYPVSSWGKNFGFVPFANYPAGTPYRVLASEDNTSVYFDGSLVAVINAGMIYPNAYTANPVTLTSPTNITADKPICVGQYAQSNGCNGSGTNQGDPDMVLLNPIEQNIQDITIFSTKRQVINTQWLNIVVKTAATGSFRISRNGQPFAPPTGTWQGFLGLPGYSYLIESLPAPGTGTGSPPGSFSDSYRLLADSGFNAICYGWGDNESYAYSAGTNIKDLYTNLAFNTPWGSSISPAVCVGSGSRFKISLPYLADSILWEINQLPGNPPDTTTRYPPSIPDSTTIVNGKTIYWYSLPQFYLFNVAGTFPVTITTYSPNSDGCGSEQEYSFDVEVYPTPVADFNFTTNGCVTNPVQFTDNSNTSGRPVSSRYWNFGDATTSTINNPSHTYAAAGAYNVKYTLITDIGCKADTASHLVTLNNPPVANFTTAGPYCEGNTIAFTNTSLPLGDTWLWDFGDGNTSALQNPTHTYAAAGTYVVQLTVGVASCLSQPKTLSVTIYAKPTSNFSFPAVVCLPSGSTQFTDLSTSTAGNAINGWLWNFGDGSPTVITQNPVHVYAGTGPYVVSLTVTTVNGCSAQNQQTINSIYAEPVAAFNSLPAVCVGSLIGFSDASTAQGSTITGWLWNFGDGSPTSTLQNPSHTYVAPGTYTVTLTVTSAVGCQTVNNIASHTVTVNQLPTVSFTSSIPNCANSPITLTSTSVANSGTITQYSWSINGVPTGGNTPTLSFTPATPGIYTILLVVQTSNGCGAQITNQVTVNPKPVANFNLPGNICMPAGTANFTNTSTISDGSPLSYAWDFGDGGTSVATNPTHNYAAPGSYTVTLVTTSNNGCTDTKVQIVNTIFAEPQAAFTAPPEVCFGTTVNFTDGSTATGSSVTGWAWDFGDGNTSTLQNPTHNYAAPGTYIVKLRVTNAVGCQTVTVNNIATRTVVVNPLPTGNFNFSAPSCETRTITFTDASAPNAGALNNWQWNFADPGSGGANTSALQNPVHTFAAAGTYDVQLTVTTDKGCVGAMFTRPVTINARPKAGFISPEVCVSDAFAPFLDTSRIATGTITGWDWNFGDPGSGPNNISTLQNPTHGFALPGTYTVRLIAISNNGCRDTILQAVTVNGAVLTPDFTVQNATTLCSNQVMSITDASVINAGSIIRTEIYWDFLNDPTNKTIVNNPVTGATYTHTYPEFGAPFTKTYQVRYVVYSGINCVNTKTRNVTILATPSLQFGPVPEVCSDAAAFQVTTATLTNGLPGGPGVFTGPGITTGGLFTPSAAGAGLHTIRFTYSGTNGCSNYVEQIFTVNQTPPVNAGPDKVVLEGGVVALTPAINASLPLTYLWSPATGLSDPNIPQPNASPATDITYTLTVTTDKGCSSSDNVFVKVLKAPSIPNIFSPNGDNVHDKWVIAYLESYPGCTVDVYNRYGQIIYHSVGYTNPWDGTVNGKPVPVGTYYYIVNPKNGRSQMSGYVDIIR